MSLLKEIEKSTKNNTTNSSNPCAEILKVIKVNLDKTLELEDNDKVRYYNVKQGVDINFKEEDQVVVVFINNDPSYPVIIGIDDIRNIQKREERNNGERGLWSVKTLKLN